MPTIYTIVDKSELILLAHGSGGKLSHDLIRKVFLEYSTEPQLLNNEDASIIANIPKGNLAFTTDSYVVKPIFFSGGNIGKLAICGTINDLCCRGSIPKYLSVGFIIEEGFLISELKQIVKTMYEFASLTGVSIITGDTKVVEKGACDKLFINTSGIGIVPEGRFVSTTNARAGDLILINGSIGDHGIAIMGQRYGFDFSTNITSDCAPLNIIIESLFTISSGIHVLKDPTRGGLATSLNEIALASNVGIAIDENSLPIKEVVINTCEMLGIDPLYLANEGKFITIVDQNEADKILNKMKKNELGTEAKIIGRVTREHPGMVVLNTIYGSQKLINIPTGDILPRIC